MTRRIIWMRVALTWGVFIALAVLNAFVLQMPVWATFIFFFILGFISTAKGFYLFPFMYRRTP